MYPGRRELCIEGDAVPNSLLRSTIPDKPGKHPFEPATSIAVLAGFANGEPFWFVDVARSSVPRRGGKGWLALLP